MEDVNKEEEWLASLLKENTKLHHKKSMEYFKEFTKISPEEMLDLRRKEAKRFNTRIVLFWKWMQSKKDLSASSLSFSPIDVIATHYPILISSLVLL